MPSHSILNSATKRPAARSEFAESGWAAGAFRSIESVVTSLAYTASVERPRHQRRAAAREHAGHRTLGAVAYRGLLLVLVLAVFGQNLLHPFVAWDDDGAIAHNPDYLPPRLTAIPHYWTDWKTGCRNFYAPVLYSVWAITAQTAYAPQNGPLWPMEAGPFHALSLAAHLLGVLALFSILRRLVENDAAAAIGAAVFAVHPIQAEAVAWASTLYTPLSAALSLWALRLYLHFSDAIDDPRGGPGAGTLQPHFYSRWHCSQSRQSYSSR